MADTTQIELLAAVLSGSPRRPIFALVTTLYPILLMEDNPIVGSVSADSIRDLSLIFESPLVGGSVSIEEITRQTVLIEYDETENEVTGTLSVESIDQVVTLIEAESTENEVEGSIDIESIDQVVTLVAVDSTENEVTGSLSIESIDQI